MRLTLSLLLAFLLGFVIGNGLPSQLGPDRASVAQKSTPAMRTPKGTLTPSPTGTPGPTPTSTVTPAPGAAIVFVASQGWTPQAEALVPIIAAQPGVGLRVHGGDVDFSFADAVANGNVCTLWPGLAYYCPWTPDMPQRARDGWRQIMALIFPGTVPWVVAWGNHEVEGTKYGEVQPYYTALFGQTARYFSVPWQTGAGDARLFILSTTGSLAPGSAQRTWFEAELARYRTATWKIVFAHGQSYSQEKPSLRLIDEGIPALLDAEGVDLWVGGHPLIWERTKQVVFNPANPQNPTVIDADADLRKGAGRVYVSAGGGGMHVCGTFGLSVPSPLKSWMARIVCIDNTFAVLRWSADGLSLTVQAIDQRGDVRDTVRLAY